MVIRQVVIAGLVVTVERGQYTTLSGKDHPGPEPERLQAKGHGLGRRQAWIMSQDLGGDLGHLGPDLVRQSRYLTELSLNILGLIGLGHVPRSHPARRHDVLGVVLIEIS
jgi:hypothetical protein